MIVYGSSNGRSKLSAEQVDLIRSSRGRVPQAELARRFGVSKTAIRHVQQGRNWRIREFPSSTRRPT